MQINRLIFIFLAIPSLLVGMAPSKRALEENSMEIDTAETHKKLRTNQIPLSTITTILKNDPEFVLIAEKYGRGRTIYNNSVAEYNLAHNKLNLSQSVDEQINIKRCLQHHDHQIAIGRLMYIEYGIALKEAFTRLTGISKDFYENETAFERELIRLLLEANLL